MRIEALRLDLRPRRPLQAADLGLALLRAHGGAAWRAWLVLWLIPGALVVLASALFPAALWLWVPLWWIRPWIERAPLYVLARAVFGEQVGWRDAVRAWPRELGGGWFRLLTWWRIAMPGRGLYQPVWQLEGARGSPASQRIAVLGRSGTGAAAWMFGVACASFEGVLAFGAIGLVSLFAHSATLNPFTLLLHATDARWEAALVSAAWVAASAVIGPVYVAGCFTLYLNRRATLEAWDIELRLRQVRRPAAVRGGLALVLAGVLLAAALPAPRAQAAAPAPRCEVDRASPDMARPARGAAQDAAQAALRARVDALYDTDDLRGWRCETDWRLRFHWNDKENKRSRVDTPPWMAWAAEALLIGAALGVLGWLAYRYRDRLAAVLARLDARRTPTAIAGLDITPDSLPADVAAQAMALWQRGEARPAFALLYRATLSRLVHDDGLQVPPGATEGDCLRLAGAARAKGSLRGSRYAVTAQVTHDWLAGAYAHRWPAADDFAQRCAAWRAAFGAAA
ncbi:MAG: hypothetical protein ACXU8N_02000 [Telluria sp.]